jgi:glycosyltransferase involved in cell wall biosynthesis
LRALRKFSLSLRDQDRSPDVIICGHVNLLPAAFLTRRTFKGKPVYLIVHGVDAWQPTGSPMVNACVRRVDGFIAVSNVTRQRFSRWAKLRADQGMVLPNCVELSAFAPGPKPPALLDRYRLKGQTVLMTLGRLASAERYKGFDEVLEIMPRLAKKIPNLAYLIAGDGPDRERLVVKAARLGMNIYDANGGGQPHPAESSPRVVFAGRISDREKADHYRLADAYVMPSSGEGFGIVFLEALACGIPVIGSRVDGSREALLNGRLGLLVDPSDPAEIESAVLKVLRREADGGVSPANGRSDDLLKFSFQNYERRVHAILDAIV